MAVSPFRITIGFAIAMAMTNVAVPLSAQAKQKTERSSITRG